MFCSPNFIRVIRLISMWLTGHVARMKDGRDTYGRLLEISAGKTQIGIYSYGWEDNIKVNLQEVLWKDEDWILSG